MATPVCVSPFCPMSANCCPLCMGWGHRWPNLPLRVRTEKSPCSSHSVREFQCPECGWVSGTLGSVPHQGRQGRSRVSAGSSKAWNPGQGPVLDSTPLREIGINNPSSPGVHVHSVYWAARTQYSLRTPEGHAGGTQLRALSPPLSDEDKPSSLALCYTNYSHN